MKKLNYIDLGAHEGQEMGLVLNHYENYEDKFDLSIYAVEAYTPFFLKLNERYGNNDRVKLFNNAITDVIALKQSLQGSWELRNIQFFSLGLILLSNS